MENTCYSCWGSKVSSQHPPRSSQTFVTPVPEDPITSTLLALHRHVVQVNICIKYNFKIYTLNNNKLGKNISQMSGPSLVSRYRGMVTRPPDLRRKDAPEFSATFRPTMPKKPEREEQMWAELLLNTQYQALFSTQQKSPLFPGEYCWEALMAP